ncbi:serine--tRNA ligase [Candidatus Curtissbacteria bacterium RBG_16_39_7]|uniref:Serine--tRNA ligase n=1 Tax=Candidatus Curtissbacteria bacterium RBG_16_39_7 TaxID=1797707 RepID=A0A1F5G1P3_9BACT|nr:MAG: serine--tRNA ligase [Candidatus Curtissbacteria bacterium RBG_16_39_7]
MLDPKFIRENKSQVQKMLAKRFKKINLDTLLVLDQKRTKLQTELDQKRARRNQIAEQISKKPELRDKLQNEGKKLKDEISKLETEQGKIQSQLNEYLALIPNLISPKTPIGRNDKENVEIKRWGKIPQFDFNLKDHLELGEKLDLLDFESGAKVAGSQFYFLKNEAVLLEFALSMYAINLLSKEGFNLVLTPDLAKERFYTGTGYLPRGPEAQTYEIKDSDLGLIATAEVALASLHADQILNEEELPKKYCGFSHCFRVEAGSYGKYSRGLYRVHQFSKVEMYVYCKPDNSQEMHEFILSCEEKIWQGLDIPYRVMNICSGDLSAQSARTFDIEAWMPGRGDWGEVTSASNTTDYQARRLGARYRKKNGQVEYLHTLNGTTIAVSRALIAILENYQRKDGSVEIPKVLQSYVGKKVIQPSKT